MFLRVSYGEDGFTIFDNITEFYSSEKNCYHQCANMNETIPDYLNHCFASEKSTYKNFSKGETPRNELKQAVTTFSYDPNATEGQSGPVRYHFIGKRYEEERFNMKKVCFKYRGEYHMMMTQYPVYVCTDEGKTIEVIK